MSASLVFFKCQVIGVIVKKKYLMKNKKSNRLYKRSGDVWTYFARY